MQLTNLLGQNTIGHSSPQWIRSRSQALSPTEWAIWKASAAFWHVSHLRWFSRIEFGLLTNGDFCLLLLRRVEATWNCSWTVKWEYKQGEREKRRGEVGVRGGRKCTSIRKEQSEERFLCASHAMGSWVASAALPLHSPPPLRPCPVNCSMCVC